MDPRSVSSLASLPRESVSDLAKYSALIMTIMAVVVYLVRVYILELVLVRRIRLFQEAWLRLEYNDQRSFMNHIVGACMKVVIISTGVYPFFKVAFFDSAPQDPLSVYSARPTYGDMMILGMQIYQVMYIFELFYRTKVSALTTAHHLATILLGQVAVALTMATDAEPDAVQEFVLCFVWGAFDVLLQLVPHITMILYRLFPTRHRFLARCLYVTAWIEFITPLVETAVVMWVYGSLWNTWTIWMKVLTPIFHVVFKAASYKGAFIFLAMATKQTRRAELAESKTITPTSPSPPPSLTEVVVIEGAEPEKSTWIASIWPRP